MEYDHNYYFYNCYTNANNKFMYRLVDSEDFFLLNDYKGKIIAVNKNIPEMFHRTVLYWKFLPRFFSCD